MTFTHIYPRCDGASINPSLSPHLLLYDLHPKDKLLAVFGFIKLGFMPGKGLLFVNSVDSAFRLKLFLEKFGIRSAVLNAELPLNSRMHILEEFNHGIFDYLLATDESMDVDPIAEEEEEVIDNAETEVDSEVWMSRRKVMIILY